MLTKNFYNTTVAMLTKKLVTNGLVLPDGTVADAGYFTQTTNMKTLDYLYSLNIASSGVGVRIGSGVTPATADDYTLENLITSGCSVVNPSAVAVSAEGDKVTASATYAVTNNGTTAIAISEIGLFGAVFDVASGTSKKTALLDRTVLESPITLNPGESKQITYTIRFNYPVE